VYYDAAGSKAVVKIGQKLRAEMMLVAALIDR